MQLDRRACRGKLRSIVGEVPSPSAQQHQFAGSDSKEESAHNDFKIFTGRSTELASPLRARLISTGSAVQARYR
jgi:hypothetical protein